MATTSVALRSTLQGAADDALARGVVERRQETLVKRVYDGYVSVSATVICMLFIKRLGASRIARSGLGPFRPEFFRALTKRECMVCGGTVGEMALVSNAIVVESRGVSLLCIRCRGGTTITTSQSSPGFLDTNGLVVALAEHKCSKSLETLDWFEALACIRLGYAYFQPHFLDPRHAFMKPRYLPNGTLPYGNVFGVLSCPECGALWRNTVYSPIDDAPGSSCGHCGTPNALQWHLRVSEEEERRLLLHGGRGS